jgi:hypothetical protein
MGMRTWRRRTGRLTKVRFASSAPKLLDTVAPACPLPVASQRAAANAMRAPAGGRLVRACAVAGGWLATITAGTTAAQAWPMAVV